MGYPSCVIALIVICIASATCEYYTSVSGMDVLLEAEGYMLEEYAIKQKNEEFLVSLRNIKDEYVSANKDPFAYISNPINAFKLIKRFVIDWSQIVAKEELETKDLATELSKIMNKTFELPSKDDLNGAAMGLMTLQETYKLDTADIANGIILGTKYGSCMTASDCLELGMSLYESGKYKHALSWLQEAIRKFRKSDNPPIRLIVETLVYLSVSYFHLGISKMALLLTYDILKLDPNNEDTVQNQKIYEDYILKDRNSNQLDREPVMIAANTNHFKELYRMTCRGEYHQTPAEQRPLRCMYTTNGAPYRLIGPLKVEQLNLDPVVEYYHEVINDGDIEMSIKEAEPIIVRSTVVGDQELITSELRTSKNGWLYFETHNYLQNIANTLTDITGLALPTGEALQILNYGIGGHYAPHCDFTSEPEKVFGDNKGNRLATALFYLNEVELGGATAFPLLKLAVQPVKGSLVLWYNLHDSLEPDFRMVHAGCPVLKGSKWILNQWFHEREQEFTKPCSLKQQGHISKPYENIY